MTSSNDVNSSDISTRSSNIHHKTLQEDPLLLAWITTDQSFWTLTSVLYMSLDFKTRVTFLVDIQSHCWILEDGRILR